MRITLCEIWAEGGATHAKERELDLEDGVIAEEALAQAGRKLASGEGPAEMEVELCPVLKLSQGLSALFGKPLIPPNCLKSSKSFLPLRILWVYA